MGEEKAIIEKLLLKEEDVLKELNRLVEKAKFSIGLEESSGRIIFKQRDVTDKQKICLYLTGKYFAKKYGFIESEIIKGQQIIDDLGRNPGTIWGKLAELKKEGLLENIQNGYRIVYHRIEEVLDKIVDVGKENE